MNCRTEEQTGHYILRKWWANCQLHIEGKMITVTITSCTGLLGVYSLVSVWYTGLLGVYSLVTVWYTGLLRVYSLVSVWYTGLLWVYSLVSVWYTGLLGVYGLVTVWYTGLLGICHFYAIWCKTLKTVRKIFKQVMWCVSVIHLPFTLQSI